ncbi:MAG: AMP-binding protein [Syntrophorhabdales bacterium]|jgi:non-ribosomal peptide synthetase component E (peptide arylation enzyme)
MTKGQYLTGANPYDEQSIAEFTEKKWWLNMTYGDVLDRTVERYPDKPALMDERMSLSYRQLKDNVDRLAIGLLEIGLKKNDIVVLQLPNRCEFYVTYYALHRIGVVPLLAVARSGYQEIRGFFDMTEAVGWFVGLRDRDKDFMPLISQVRSEIPGCEHLIVLDDGLPLPEGAHSLHSLIARVDPAKYAKGYLDGFRPDPNDVAVILTTGGTTGAAKGAPRTHNSYLAAVRYSCEGDVTPESVLGVVTPVGHSMAHQGAGGGAITYGATLVIGSVPRAREILELIQKWRLTWLVLVPTQLEDIVNFPELEKYDITSLKYVGSTGAALSPSTAEKVNRLFDRTGIKFDSARYGSSEGPVTRPPLSGAPIPRGSVGVPVCPGDRWKVVDARGAELPPGSEGELAVMGPCVFTGYFRSEEDNKGIFTADGYYKTGDLGRVDTKGFIYITGRAKDVIQRGAESISPKQIEEQLEQLPSIAQAAVVGMPDRRLGERICAYVKLKPGTKLEFTEMIGALRDRGAGVLLLPERLELIDEFPLTKLGKVDKKALVKDITEKLEKEGVI